MPARKPHLDGFGPTRLTRAEFAQELRANAERLWTVAAGVLGDPSEAEDVVQEAALAALGKLGEFDRRTSFTAWMGAFVRNMALNAARKNKRRATHPVPTEHLDGLPGNGSHAGAGRSRISVPPENGALVDHAGNLHSDQGAFDDRVFAALRELAPVPRAALLLRTVLDLSYAEISSVLDIPMGTAMSHVHRARTRMRDELLDPSEGGSPASRRDELALNPELGDRS